MTVYKGLQGINSGLDAQAAQQMNEDLNASVAEYQKYVRKVTGVEGGEHLQGLWLSDEDGETDYLVVHFDKDTEIIGIAGWGDTAYEAWLDVPVYCVSEGIDHDTLMQSHKESMDRWAIAWREQYPEEARAYDERKNAPVSSSDNW